MNSQYDQLSVGLIAQLLIPIIGRALHRNRRGHGFKSRSSLFNLLSAVQQNFKCPGRAGVAIGEGGGGDVEIPDLSTHNMVRSAKEIGTRGRGQREESVFKSFSFLEKYCYTFL